MISNFVFSLNVVLPLFLCCIVGHMARRLNLVTEAFVSECSRVVFYIAIPANIFLSISGSDLSKSFDLSLLIYLFAVILALSILLVLIVPKFISDRPIAATVTIAMFRGNFAMLGIPLAISLMGTEGATPTMVMIPFATVFYTVITVLILVLMGKSHTGSTLDAVKNAIKEVGKNPLIIASIASILFALLGMSLPTFVNSTIERFADMCTGLALLMLGAQLNVNELFERLKYTVSASIVRLIIIPLVVVSLAAYLGFRDSELACVLIFFASPTAVNSYILAGRMGGDGKLAGDIVLTTSCFSTITLMVGIFILKNLQLI